MSRARNIKPGFFKNEDLAECSPWARLLFAGLWTLADREGRLEWRPKRIKAEIFPFDDCDITELTSELARWGFVIRYEVSGMGYLQIVNFLKHQRPHHKEVASELPEPPIELDSSMAQAWAELESSMRQAQTKENDSCALIPDSLNRIPDSEPCQPKIAEEPAILEYPTAGRLKNWNLTQPLVNEFSEAYPGVDVLAECRAARQWVLACPSRKKTSAGMRKFLNGWLSRAQNQGRKAREGPATGSRVPSDEELKAWNPLDGGLNQETYR